MPYADLDSLRGRSPHRTIDANSKPTATEVQAWLDEGQAILDSELKAGEMPAPYSDADAIKERQREEQELAQSLAEEEDDDF